MIDFRIGGRTENGYERTLRRPGSLHGPMKLRRHKFVLSSRQPHHHRTEIREQFPLQLALQILFFFKFKLNQKHDELTR